MFIPQQENPMMTDFFLILKIKRSSTSSLIPSHT